MAIRHLTPWVDRYDRGVVLAPLWLALLGHDEQFFLPPGELDASRRFLVGSGSRNHSGCWQLGEPAVSPTLDKV